MRQEITDQLTKSTAFDSQPPSSPISRIATQGSLHMGLSATTNNSFTVFKDFGARNEPLPSIELDENAAIDTFKGLPLTDQSDGPLLLAYASRNGSKYSTISAVLLRGDKTITFGLKNFTGVVSKIQLISLQKFEKKVEKLQVLAVFFSDEVKEPR